MKVTNLFSSRTGNKVANQFEIEKDGVVYFQSYDTIIAKKDLNGVTLNNQFEYSRTTSKYLCQFLRQDSIKDIRNKVENGHYKLENLN